jgi:hypothetical protein
MSRCVRVCVCVRGKNMRNGGETLTSSLLYLLIDGIPELKEREGEREREGDRGGEGERERGREGKRKRGREKERDRLIEYKYK